MKRKITKTKKNFDGDILSLCNPNEWWSPVPKSDAIREIEIAGEPYSENSPYYTEYAGIKASIVVVNRNGKKYLRTDPDKTTGNNLAFLPDC